MAKDISEDLYAKIKDSFDRRYENAQLLGEPLHDVFSRIRNGTATFRDADMYAVAVGSMLSDSLKDHLKLEKMPNQTFYRNIAQKTIGEGMKDSYGIVSNAAAVAQEELNAAAGIGLKPVKPKLDIKTVDQTVERASRVSTQQELDAVLTEPVKTFARRVVDDTKKANARLHNKAGLEVKVEREYDGVGLHEGTDVCDWCVQRAGTWTYEKAMANGVFERHEGCGCIIDYTSKKGEKARSTGKYSGFKAIENPERMEQRVLDTMAGKTNFFVGKNGKVISSQYAAWIGENKMKEYLQQYTSEQAQKYIKADFRPSSFIGDGSTADIRKFEIATGINCGRNGGNHAQKVDDLLRFINRISLNNVPESDKIFLERMRRKLEGVSNS